MPLAAAKKNWPSKSASPAFTLIELLIVVLIIAILAAIAIPNFMEFQTRAKVSRCKSDMRTIAVALEAYYVDNDEYPTWRSGEVIGAVRYTAEVCHQLTTPVAFLTSMPKDPFGAQKTGREMGNTTEFHYFSSFDATLDWFLRPHVIGEISTTIEHFKGWCLISYGPDLDFDDSFMIFEECIWGTPVNEVLIKQQRWFYGISAKKNIDRIYDPTNGTASDGDLLRIAGPPFDSFLGG